MRFVIEYGSGYKIMFIASYVSLKEYLDKNENDWLREYVEKDMLKMIDFDNKPCFNNTRIVKYTFLNYHFNVFLLRYMQTKGGSKEKIYPCAVQRIIASNHEYCTIGGDATWD